MPTSWSATAPGWGRARLLSALVGILLAFVILVGGLVGLIRDAADGTLPYDDNVTPTFAADDRTSVRDAIAAAPMLDVTPADARRGTPSVTAPAPLTIPPPTTKGPASVPSGFPHTPAGAVGQLAAIDTTVLTAMNIPVARDVHDDWTIPGAPALEAWPPTAAVRAFRTASNTTGPVAVAVNPVAAQLKGSDGPDWVLACVLYRIDAAVTRAASVAYGRCERLEWREDRWVVAPGPAPAGAPATWPGTDLAAAAGWRPWRTDLGPP